MFLRGLLELKKDTQKQKLVFFQHVMVIPAAAGMRRKSETVVEQLMSTWAARLSLFGGVSKSELCQRVTEVQDV